MLEKEFTEWGLRAIGRSRVAVIFLAVLLGIIAGMAWYILRREDLLDDCQRERIECERQANQKFLALEKQVIEAYAKLENETRLRTKLEAELGETHRRLIQLEKRLPR